MRAWRVRRTEQQANGVGAQMRASGESHLSSGRCGANDGARRAPSLPVAASRGVPCQCRPTARPQRGVASAWSAVWAARCMRSQPTWKRKRHRRHCSEGEHRTTHGSHNAGPAGGVLRFDSGSTCKGNGTGKGATEYSSTLAQARTHSDSIRCRDWTAWHERLETIALLGCSSTKTTARQRYRTTATLQDSMQHAATCGTVLQHRRIRRNPLYHMAPRLLQRTTIKHASQGAQLPSE